jgi:SAM-dependent methyltransferase
MAQAWEQTGPPLRPSAGDIALYRRLAWEWIDLHGAPRILLLGVTPEIYNIPWPPGHDFLAVDRTPAMIDHVWPGARSQVLQAEWLELPLPRESRDLAFCDGGLHLLTYPRGQETLVARLHDALAPGGRCVFRLQVPPPVRESPDRVLADLFAGCIPDLNVLKLRLAMAMQESPSGGIAVREIWSKLRGLAAEWEGLAARLGWELAHLQVIDAYRDSGARYHFVSRAEVEALFSEGGKFACIGCHAGNSPFPLESPVIVFERL